MRISLLLKREPFGEILERTLADFLQSRFGTPHEVHWYFGRRDVTSSRYPGKQTWLCNTLVNALFVPEARSEVFDPIWREYSRSTVWWHRSAQRAYVSLALAKLSRKWLAQAAISVSPAVNNADYLLIVAGNHKIRLLDRHKGVCYSILKHGFSPRYLNREVTSRQLANRQGVPVPSILSDSHGECHWFCEDYLGATPVNRLVHETQACHSISVVAKSLFALLRHTLMEAVITEYIANLRWQIGQLVTGMTLLTRDQKEALIQHVQDIAERVRSNSDDGNPCIFTAMTHGDFQPANILVNKDGPWLIDWEYSERRQSGYDALVIGLRARSPNGLANRLHQFVEGQTLVPPISQDTAWPGVRWENRADRQIAADLFMLEESIIHLEENDNTQFTAIGNGLQLLLKEIGRWVGWNNV